MSNNTYERSLYVGPFTGSDATRSSGRAHRTGEQVFSEVHGRYSEQSKRGNIFMAQAIVTAPVIWTTEAGTGGPLLWNSSSTVECNILAVGWGQTTVTTVAAAVGLTGGYNQTTAPSSTTAIDSQGCLRVSSATPQASVYRVGTTNDNKWFMPIGQVHTGALTTTPGDMQWTWLDGLVCVPQNAYVSIAASATATTLVIQTAIIWEEIPV